MYLDFLSNPVQAPSSWPLTTKIRTGRPHLLALTPAQTSLRVNISSSFKLLDSVLYCDRSIVWRYHVSSRRSWFCSLLGQACRVWCWCGYLCRGSNSSIFRIFMNAAIMMSFCNVTKGYIVLFYGVRVWGYLKLICILYLSQVIAVFTVYNQTCYWKCKMEKVGSESYEVKSVNFF